MNDKLDHLLEQIQAMPVMAEEALLLADDDQIIDVLGDLNSVQSRLQQSKLRAASEVMDGDSGRRWQFEQRRSARRTYNTSGLLAMLMDALDADTLSVALLKLLDMGVIRISWQWSKLQALTREHNIQLRKANHAVNDGEPNIEIGEVWASGQPKYVYIGEETDE